MALQQQNPADETRRSNLCMTDLAPRLEICKKPHVIPFVSAPFPCPHVLGKAHNFLLTPYYNTPTRGGEEKQAEQSPVREHTRCTYLRWNVAMGGGGVTATQQTK